MSLSFARPWNLFACYLEANRVVELDRDVRQFRVEGVIFVNVLKIMVQDDESLAAGSGYPMQAAIDS